MLISVPFIFLGLKTFSFFMLLAPKERKRGEDGKAIQSYKVKTAPACRTKFHTSYNPSYQLRRCMMTDRMVKKQERGNKVFPCPKTQGISQLGKKDKHPGKYINHALVYKTKPDQHKGRSLMKENKYSSILG